MKKLYLLRHAHALPRETSLSDYDRPLDDEGRREAGSVAKFIKEKKLSFDLVLCSGALRAQETLEPLRDVIGTEEIYLSDDFYNIPENIILSHIQKISDTINTVLYIGHNPGIAFTALKLATTFDDVLKEGMPSATLIGYELPVDDWKLVDWRRGTVINVFQPSQEGEDSPEPEGS